MQYKIDDESTLFRVNYSKSFAYYNPYDAISYSMYCNISKQKKDISSLESTLFINPLRTKSTEWKYEKEVRIIDIINDKNMNKNVHYYKIGSPQIVYLGSKFEENDKEKKDMLNDILSKLKIDARHMELSKKYYRVIVKK